MIGGLGIYQAFFPFGVSLCIVLLIFHLLGGDAKPEVIFKEACKYLGLLVVSVIGYGMIAAGFIYKFGLTNHHTGSLIPENTGDVLQRFKNMYINFFTMISQDYYGISYNIYVRTVIIILLILTAGILVWNIVLYLKKGLIWHTILLLGFVVILPISINLLYILNTDLYTLMVYAIVCLLIFPILYFFKGVKDDENSAIKVTGQYIATGASIIMIFIYCSLANETYLEMSLAINGIHSYATTLITQIKSVDGYEEGMPVVFVGDRWNHDETVADIKGEIFSNINVGGYIDTNWIVSDSLKLTYYMRQYCGFDVEIQEASAVEAMGNSKKIQDMPNYPNWGSIQIVEGTVIVKFSDTIS